MKRCSSCNETKELSCFHRNRRSHDLHSNRCKICHKAYRVTQRSQEYGRRYREKNKDKINEQQSQRRKSCPEQYSAYRRRYVESHRDTIRKCNRAFYNSPEQRPINNSRAALRRLTVRQATFSQFKAEIEKIYTLCPPGHHVDHIVPLKGKDVCGLHVPWNLQYLPALDNLKKGNRFQQENCK